MNDSKVKRIGMMALGVAFIGIGSGIFRYCGFGADPFTTMNLGISSLLHMSFGNLQLIMNLLLFIPVIVFGRYTIGLGTAANMILIGYISDAMLYLTGSVLGETALFLRYILMFAAMVLSSFGVACYIVPNLGVAPYDALQLLAQKYSKGKISYRMARIVCDATCIIVGMVTIAMSGNSIFELIGLGTICNVAAMGPIIQFFKEKLTFSKLETTFA